MTFSYGDTALQAWHRVKVLDTRKSARMGVEHKVQRLDPEPVGYNPDGTLMTSVGHPFWVSASMLKPLPEET